MAELLNQQEIDQLLNKVSTGEAEENVSTPEYEVTPFDFRLPNRISKIQLRTLRNLHESFAESFASFLVSKLQSIVSINVTSIDQIYYSEYLLSVSNPACLFIFGIENYDVKGILEFSNDFALTLVDRLLGGNGTGTKQTKVITPIEQKVLSSIVERVMIDLKKGWQIISNFDFQVERFESDIDFAQITSQSESVLLISFEIIIGENTYLMNLCFSTYAFDSIISKLSSQSFSSIRPVKYNGTTAEEILKNQLYNTLVPVIVEFGRTKISVNEMIELEIGDILKLENKVNDPQIIKVGSKPMFMGKVGKVNKNKAVKIINEINSEDNLIR